MTVDNRMINNFSKGAWVNLVHNSEIHDRLRKRFMFYLADVNLPSLQAIKTVHHFFITDYLRGIESRLL